VRVIVARGGKLRMQQDSRVSFLVSRFSFLVGCRLRSGFWVHPSRCVPDSLDTDYERSELFERIQRLHSVEVHNLARILQNDPR
jgi:hypothetical protein